MFAKFVSDFVDRWSYEQ